MTGSPGFGIAMIGDRINPGFKSTRELLDNEDMAGVQALAVKQVEAGAFALDVTIGPRGSTDFDYLAKVVRAIQEAVPVQLCFDSPSAQVQEVCFKAYDRARGGPALINSITEQRWDIMDLYKDYGPFQVIVMASERMEDGIAKQNKTADEIASTAKRAALRLQNDYGMPLNDIYIDISVSAVVADTNGLHRATLDAVRMLHTDPQLKGLHIMGGLTNIGQQLPPKGSGRIGPEAVARVRVPHFGGAARLRHHPVYAVAQLPAAAGRQLRAQSVQEYPRADRQQRAARRAQALPRLGFKIGGSSATASSADGVGRLWRSADAMVLINSIVTVIGPTPPGTGVI